jgi:YVTN family beta-propeller protein
VTITPDGSQAWIADADGKQIDVISTATNTVISTIPVPGGPNQITFTGDGTTAYVTEAGCVCCAVAAKPGNEIAIIDTATFQITGRIPAGGETQGIALMP